MKRKFPLSGKIVRRASVADKKLLGKYNLFKMFNKFGANFGKQVLCHKQQVR